MARDIPPFLTSLLHAADASERERAWATFVDVHSRLLLHAIRQFGGSHDDVMDRYAYVLEQLRAQDFRRLRSWSGDGRSRLSTWLVVVARRLCADYHRQRYGRSHAARSPADASRDRRRMLADFIVEELQADSVATDSEASTHADPEKSLRTAELLASLNRALRALAPPDRLMLALRFRDDMSAARIATVLALPTPFHVYRRLNHLLGVLRDALKDQGVEDPVP